MSVTALVGAQYGSEGKGAIAAKIAMDFGVHIRTGAPNAGHTYYVDPRNDELTPGSTMTMDGKTRVKIVARSIPIGVSNPEALLVIGPGALIDVELLIHEVKELELLGFELTHRLFVDAKAVVIDPTRHHALEGGTGGYAHDKIGSTGEGVGPARMAHAARTTMSGSNIAWTFVDHAGDSNILSRLTEEDIIVWHDTAKMVNERIEGGDSVLLEGTQGSGLSLVHGHWPYVTSTDTNAAQMLVDAGISPLHLTDVLMVARTFPIRVAGNSGPLEDETTFEEIGQEPEYTTVTKKMRRIGRFDDAMFDQAVRLNGPDPRVAITFLDYLFPATAGVTDYKLLQPQVIDWIYNFEQQHSCQIDYLGTGPDSIILTPNARWGR